MQAELRRRYSAWVLTFKEHSHYDPQDRETCYRTKVTFQPTGGCSEYEGR